MSNVKNAILIMFGLVAFWAFVVSGPRVNAPDSLRRTQYEGVTQEQANIALTVSEATLNDSQSGMNYVEQWYKLSQAFGALAVGLIVCVLGIAMTMCLGAVFRALFGGIQYGSDVIRQ